MSRDISDNQSSPEEFLHNIIYNRTRDLSNNTRLQFLSYLISAIDNEFSDNLSVLPLANNFMNGTSGLSNQATINQLLNSTLLQEKEAYKKILSEKGEEQLKTVIYKKENFDTKQCVISMEDFNDGDTVIQLPCGHIFHPESIKTWLKEESSKCPICRYELKFDEVKKDFPQNTRVTNATLNSSRDISGNNSTRRSQPGLATPLTPFSNLLSRQRSGPSVNPYTRMFNNMDFLYNPTNSINRPRRRNLISQRDIVNRILRVNNYIDEDSQMQNAIMASIYESSSVNTDLNTAINTPLTRNTNEIIQNYTNIEEENTDQDSDEENLLAPMTLNETMLQDIDSDDELF